jgi:hypothetical protein
MSHYNNQFLSLSPNPAQKTKPKTYPRNPHSVQKRLARYTSLSVDALEAATSDQYANWYPLPLTYPLLGTLRTVNFSDDANRLAAVDAINSLHVQAPYAIVDGFGDVLTDYQFSQIIDGIEIHPGAFWVAGFCDGWPEIFSGLLFALQNPTAIIDTDLADGLRFPPPGLRAATDYSSAAAYYARVVNLMFTYLRDRTGVYNQPKFELKYALTWDPSF